MDIVIRRLEPTDYLAVQKIFVGPKAIWGTSQLPFPSIELWRKKLAEPPPGLFSLVACVGDEIAGTLGIHTFPDNPRRRHVGQLGMAVRDDFQGKGVGSALMKEAVNLADKWINLSRLELEVYCDNSAAVALYKKFGFEVEGRLFKFSFRDGEYVDAFFMARLRQG